MTVGAQRIRGHDRRTRSRSGQGAAELDARQGETTVATRASADHSAANQQQHRDPLNTLTGCERILILGRTGSGKTRLARELAAALDVPHVELDSLYFGPDFSRAPLSLLRERTSAAIAGDRWVTDGNKRAVRDLVWPRADTIVWLDYPVYVSLWRLAKRARTRTLALSAKAAQTGRRNGLPKQMLAAKRGAHGAQITSGTAPGIPAYVRPAGEPASRGGTPAFAACYSSADSSRHRGGPPAGVGTGGAVRAARRTLYCCFPCNGAAAQHQLVPPRAQPASSSWRSDSLSRALYGGVLLICRTKGFSRRTKRRVTSQAETCEPFVFSKQLSAVGGGLFRERVLRLQATP